MKISSFGFKHGGFGAIGTTEVIDCRNIVNPHSNQKLRVLTGKDEAVQKYVMDDREATIAFRQGAEALRNGKDVAFGCLGGKHRSVALAEVLAKHARGAGHTIELSHRELAD